MKVALTVQPVAVPTTITVPGDAMSSSSSLPVRVALAPGDRRSRRRLASRLGGFERRVQVLRGRDSLSPDLVLVDPCVDGGSLDLAGLQQAAGEGLVVVYTDAPAVDELAFAMAGSVMDGRLRGWLSPTLCPADLVEALERIHRGDIVIESASA